MNFDKAIVHFEAAHTAARNGKPEALTELAAGLQRLSEALHHDIDQILRSLQQQTRPPR